MVKINPINAFWEMLAKLDPILSKVEPNKITTWRLKMIPFALAALLWASAWSLTVCLMLMIVIGIFDFLDGYVARRFSKGSDFGKVYDPMCDATFHVAMYIGLILFFGSKLFALAVMIIFFRELSVAYLRVACALKGLALAAMVIGKVKAWAQLISIFSCVIWLLLSKTLVTGTLVTFWFYASIVLVTIALVITLVSFRYYWSFFKKNFLADLC